MRILNEKEDKRYKKDDEYKDQKRDKDEDEKGNEDEDEDKEENADEEEYKPIHQSLSARLRSTASAGGVKA